MRTPKNTRLLDGVPLEARLAHYSARAENGCLIWTGTKTAGYGQLWWDGRMQGAHRLSWEVANQRPAPRGMCVCHNCPGGDNRLCIEPSHMFIGTRAENILDAVAKGRNPRGETHGCAILKAEQVRRIWRDDRRLVDIAAEYRVSKHVIWRSDIESLGAKSRRSADR